MVPVVTGQYPKPMKTHASRYNTNLCPPGWGRGLNQGCGSGSALFSLLDPDPHSISRSVSRRGKFKGKNPPKDARKLVIIEF